MRWICTTEQKPYAERKAQTAAGGIAIELGGRKQALRGFGGCFNELGHKALMKLSATARESIMKELFDPNHMGFRFCRVPIGANDLAENWYSYNDHEGDYAMEHFSIERDKRHVLPYIQEAKAHCPSLELFASPWSPPTWMKFPAVYNYGRLKRDDQTQRAYADYLTKFVKAYAAQGIEVQRLCVQNEVFADQKFPSCLWSGEEMRTFIRDYLGPKMAEEHLPTELWLGTINGPFVDYENKDW